MGAFYRNDYWRSRKQIVGTSRTWEKVSIFFYAHLKILLLRGGIKSHFVTAPLMSKKMSCHFPDLSFSGPPRYFFCLEMVIFKASEFVINGVLQERIINFDNEKQFFRWYTRTFVRFVDTITRFCSNYLTCYDPIWPILAIFY